MHTRSRVSANSRDLRRLVHPAAGGEAARPGEDRGDRVGRGGFALLVLAEVAGDGAVGRLGLDGLAIGRHQDARHQAERAEPLGDRVRLDVAVVVLAGPDVAALPLERRRDHVVDQPVLVGDVRLLELLLELRVVDLLEDVLEAAVVALQDRVLGRQVDRKAAVEAVAQRGPREVPDRVVEVVHRQRDPAARKVVDVELHRLAAVLGRVGHGQLPLPRHDQVGRPVLVAEGVTADHDRLGPARDQARHVRDHDRLAEDDPAEDVPDRPVGRAIHLLEAELLDPGLVRRDRRALDPDAVLLDRVGGVDRDLVLGLVPLLDREVEVQELDVEVGQDQLLLDEVPDDPGHLVAVELDDGVLDLDSRHKRGAMVCQSRCG